MEIIDSKNTKSELKQLRQQIINMLKTYESRSKLDDAQVQGLYAFVKQNAGEGKLFDAAFASQMAIARKPAEKTTTDQDIAKAKTKGQRDALLASLDEENKKALKIVDAEKERATIEQRINDLLKERQRLLPTETQEQREQVRLELQMAALEAQRNKEKALITTLKQNSEKIQASTFGNIFASLGFDKSMMDSLLAGYSSTTGKGSMEVMNDLIRQELYNRELKGGDWNGQKIPAIENTTFSSLLQNNPGLFTDVMKSIGGKMQTGKLDYMITTDAINNVKANLAGVDNESFKEGLNAAGITDNQLANNVFNPQNATNANQVATMESIDKMLDFYVKLENKFKALQTKLTENGSLTAEEDAEYRKRLKSDQYSQKQHRPSEQSKK